MIELLVMRFSSPEEGCLKFRLTMHALCVKNNHVYTGIFVVFDPGKNG